MRRCGQIPEAKDDAWFDAAAKSVYQPHNYKQAAEALIADGLATAGMFGFDVDGYRETTSDFVDGIAYNDMTPNAYIDSLPIGLTQDTTLTGREITN